MADPLSPSPARMDLAGAPTASPVPADRAGLPGQAGAAPSGAAPQLGDGTGPAGTAAQPDRAPGFLKVLRRGLSMQARAMRLREGDVLVGVNGAPFAEGMSVLAERFDALDEEDIPQPLLLTFFRDGVFFHQAHEVLPRFDSEICDPDRAIEIARKFAGIEIAPPDRYENYEVFRDIRRSCSLHTTTPDPLATLAPPLWMLNHRLMFPLLAVLIVYGTTFLTHWAMFVLAYGLVSVYTRRAQINLLRSYQMYAERFFWVVVAETDEIRARATCRAFDPEVTFLSEPQPPRKKRRARAAGAGAAPGSTGRTR